MYKLEPCPICGKEGAICQVRTPSEPYPFYGLCEHCKRVTARYTTKEEAMEAWNGMANDGKNV